MMMEIGLKTVSESNRKSDADVEKKLTQTLQTKPDGTPNGKEKIRIGS